MASQKLDNLSATQTPGQVSGDGNVIVLIRYEVLFTVISQLLVSKLKNKIKGKKVSKNYH